VKLLLDTHIFLWAIADPGRLSATQRREIEDPINTVYLSSVSVSELAIKASLGKLSFDFDLLAIAEKSGFELLDFSASDALLLKDLPFHHRDPFDRMLIVQAQARDLFIATQDTTFALYDCRVLS
jgi:PIN domain nuclease of toxin-antitoxin system